VKAKEDFITKGESLVIITYGMGVYWAKEAAQTFEGQIEIIDLRTLNPIDWNCITEAARKHGKVFILTEEPLLNSFAESLAGRISKECFQWLDAPVWTLGAVDLPAIPLNVDLEKRMLPSSEKVKHQIELLLRY
jgi:2-oxoisovalerate dehydrogenase E1 component